jgi:nucleoside-diphosphate-sugar epimerase
MSHKKTIVVIGSGGFVGSQIVRSLIDSNKYNVLQSLRDDPTKYICDQSDIIIHAANPAKRFRAEKDPETDFHETVEKTSRFFDFAKNKRFILISTLSCRTQLYTNYGRNRRACELIVSSGNSLVIRLGPMFGEGRTQDTLHDILNGQKIFVSADSKYAYTDIKWNAQQIVELLESSIGIKEIGARNSVRLGDLATYFSSKSEFEGVDDTQIPETLDDGPDANLVYNYAKTELSTKV